MANALDNSGCDFSCGDPRVAKQLEHCGQCPVRNLAVCASLENEEMNHLAEFVVGQEVPPGKTLFSEGDPATHVFTITDGAAKTYKLLPDGRRQITGFLFAGDFVGLTHDSGCVFTAEALNNMQVCRFDRERFNQTMATLPNLRARLLSDTSAELAAAHRQMLLLGRKTARERVATFLLMVDERTNGKDDAAADRGDGPAVVSLPMTRGDIADYLGLTTETVSRTFTHLRSKGLIRSLPGHDVEIIDRDSLEDVAEG